MKNKLETAYVFVKISSYRDSARFPRFRTKTAISMRLRQMNERALVRGQ